MNSILNIFIEIFQILAYRTVFGVPLLVWFLLPAVISIAVKFIQGKK